MASRVFFWVGWFWSLLSTVVLEFRVAGRSVEALVTTTYWGYLASFTRGSLTGRGKRRGCGQAGVLPCVLGHLKRSRDIRGSECLNEGIVVLV